MYYVKRSDTCETTLGSFVASKGFLSFKLESLTPKLDLQVVKNRKSFKTKSLKGFY